MKFIVVFGLLVLGCSLAAAQSVPRVEVSDSADVTSTTNSQGQVSCGVMGGVGIVTYQTGPIQTPEPPDCYATMANGSGWDAMLGLSFSYTLDKLSQHSLVANVGYGGKSGQLVTASPCLSYREDNSQVPTLNAEIHTMQFDLDYKFNFVAGEGPSGFGLAAGPSLIAVLGTPKFITSQSGLLATDRIDDYHRLIAGWNFSTFYDIPFANRWYVEVLAGIDEPITRFSTKYDWKLKGTYGGLTVSYRIPR